MIQEAYIKQWKDFSQAALALYKDSSEAQTGAIRDLDAQYDSAAWAKLARLYLDSSKGILEINQSAANTVWLAQLGKLDSSSGIDSLTELTQIYTSTMTTLIQSQMSSVTAMVEETRKYLQSVKQAQGMEEMLAAPAHFFTAMQEKQKNAALGTMATLGSVQTALTAFVERTIDNAAAAGEAPTPKPTALPRAPPAPAK